MQLQPPPQQFLPAPPHRQQPSHVAASAHVEVSFRVNFRADFGTYLHVSGDAPALGGWSPLAAPRMQWHEGDDWVATVRLPAGPRSPAVVGYKYVVLDPTGRPVRWQEGPNLTLSLSGAAPGACLDCTDSWCGAVQMRSHYPASAWPSSYTAWSASPGGSPRSVSTFMPPAPPPPPTAWPDSSGGGSGGSFAGGGFAAERARAALPALQQELAEALAALPAGPGGRGGAPDGAAAALGSAMEGLRALQSMAQEGDGSGRGRSAGGPAAFDAAAAARDVQRLRAAFSPFASGSFEEDEEAAGGKEEEAAQGEAAGADALAAAPFFGAAALLGMQPPSPRPPAPASSVDAYSAHAPAPDAAAAAAAAAAAYEAPPLVPGACPEDPLMDPLVAALLSTDAEDCELCCTFLQDAISSCGGSMDSTCSMDWGPGGGDAGLTEAEGAAAATAAGLLPQQSPSWGAAADGGDCGASRRRHSLPMITSRVHPADSAARLREGLVCPASELLQTTTS